MTIALIIVIGILLAGIAVWLADVLSGHPTTTLNAAPYEDPDDEDDEEDEDDSEEHEESDKAEEEDEESHKKSVIRYVGFGVACMAAFWLGHSLWRELHPTAPAPTPVAHFEANNEYCFASPGSGMTSACTHVAPMVPVVKTVASTAELPTCDEKNKGGMVYVTEQHTLFQCEIGPNVQLWMGDVRTNDSSSGTVPTVR